MIKPPSQSSIQESGGLIYETFVGVARTPLRLSAEDYFRWLSNIRSDQNLMADIRAIQLGKQPMGDLDEGDAGIFEGRVFPHTERVGEKLEGYDARSRHVLLAALLPRVLADLERY